MVEAVRREKEASIVQHRIQCYLTLYVESVSLGERSVVGLLIAQKARPCRLVLLYPSSSSRHRSPDHRSRYRRVPDFDRNYATFVLIQFI